VPQFLDTPIEYLKGVGPQKADTLKKELGIFTFGDMLSHYPFRYVDRSHIYKIGELKGDFAYIQVKGKFSSFSIEGTKQARRLKSVFTDGTGFIEVVWFKGINWIEKFVVPGREYIMFGKPNEFMGKLNIVHPEVEDAKEFLAEGNGGYQPVYSTTEILKRKGLDSKGLMKLVKLLVADRSFEMKEILPQEVMDDFRLISREAAYLNIHFPENDDWQKKAQFRLKFEELFFLQLKMLRIRGMRRKDVPGIVFGKVGHYFNTFYNQVLPFELTNAQKRVVKEIRQDMGSGKQMNRLLQGDVGSGKTVVGFMCMLIAIDNGTQACMMAPTEILAQQHYNNIRKFADDLGLNTALLTGSTPQKARREMLPSLENGTLHILVGTHALIEDKVKFNNLGLTIIDEQHRFGVQQRAKLWNKSLSVPHVLVMTATPIPRTLAMTVYGDLDTSVIDEMPAGRKPINTAHRYDSNRLRVFGFIEEEIAKGRQAYIVYPLIEESEKLDYKNLMDGFESVTRAFPAPKYSVSIVHGQMKPADKEYEMQRFKKGETQIMVATTVIEVGVDVPNASVMVIESAERFGLSQLHQLRGRVGRGAEQSYCILMTSHKLSHDGRQRIETMVRTNNGFEIAEVDLQLRGPGDIEGVRQSGIADLKLTDLSKDKELITIARHAAEKIMEIDVHLQLPQHQPLLQYLLSRRKDGFNWSRVS
jgi:ATP-dependent DNA helicase RecG